MQIEKALRIVKQHTSTSLELQKAYRAITDALQDQYAYIERLEKETERIPQVLLHDSALTVTGLQARLAFVRKQYGDIPIECCNNHGSYDTAEDVIVESIGPPEQQHLVAFITT